MRRMYLVSFTKPARPCKWQLEATTPEDAAVYVKTQLPNSQDIVVEILGEDDSDLVVYEWCGSCGLPIWLTDDSSTYKTFVSNDASDVAIVHTACLEGAHEADPGE